VLRYYITDRTQFHGDETARRKALLDKIAEASHADIDFIQLREKDLSTRDLTTLAREALRVIRQSGNTHTRLLINSRTDIAVAVGAHGVHLRSDDVSPQEIRAIWPAGGASPLISISCHEINDVDKAAKNGADLALFSPVFEKLGATRVPSSGLARLHKAAQLPIPVLALGGITAHNVQLCLDAGATGVAGIRIFQARTISAP
jgi:thiamine-phosphate pyrophosphorylase